MLKGGSFHCIAVRVHTGTQKVAHYSSEVSTKFLMLYPGLDRCAYYRLPVRDGFNMILSLIYWDR